MNSAFRIIPLVVIASVCAMGKHGMSERRARCGARIDAS